jgi:hypothetical protein
MAKFISIPVTSKGTTLVSTDGLCTEFINATTIKLAAGGRLVTLTIAGTATAATLAVINDAAVALNGPTVVPVVFPTGQTCTTAAIS